MNHKQQKLQLQSEKNCAYMANKCKTLNLKMLKGYNRLQQKRQNEVTSLIDKKRQQLTEKQRKLKEWIHFIATRRQQLL